MNKRKLHHAWNRLRSINYWFLLLLAVIFGYLAASALRDNNLRMIKLKEAVISADQQNGDVERALYELRTFVYGHMNTDLSSGGTSIKPPIQLKYRYERLLEQENERVRQANIQVVSDAQAHCEKLFPAGHSGSSRIPCVKEYIETHGVSAKPIPEDLYKFDFVSPTWSPDTAGWLLVLSGFFFFSFTLSFVLERWMNSQLKHHL